MAKQSYGRDCKKVVAICSKMKKRRREKHDENVVKIHIDWIQAIATWISKRAKAMRYTN